MPISQSVDLDNISATVVAGEGTAGTSVGGVVSVQGVTNGTPLPTVGNVAAASLDSGNPIKIGGVFTTPQPVLTTGERGNVQLDSRGQVLVTQSPNLATYTASIASLSPTSSATDILSIKGSATKTVIVNQVNISGIQTTAGSEIISLVKRSTANTGGGVGTIVQAVNDFTTTSSTTATITIASTGAGNLLVVATSDNDARTVTAVSDGTNAFTQATNAAGSNGAPGARTDIWYLLSSTAGKTTITVTYSGASTTKAIYFWEISGTTTGFELANRINNGVVGAIDTGGAVTSTNTAFVVGIIQTAGTITASPSASNSQFTNGAITTGSKAAATWTLGGMATYTPTWDDSGVGLFASSTAAFTAIGNSEFSVTPVSHDSNDSAATAVVNYYSSNPTLGTTVGTVRSIHTLIPTASTSPSYISWALPNNFAKGIVLNGVNESLNINLNGGTVPGGSLSIDIEWTEQ